MNKVNGLAAYHTHKSKQFEENWDKIKWNKKKKKAKVK